MRLARLRQRRRAERDVELVRVAGDGEPGEPDRAAGHAPRLDVERAVGQRDRVGAGPPVGADRERHDVVARDEVDVDEALDLVADSATVALPAEAEAMRSFASSPGA